MMLFVPLFCSCQDFLLHKIRPQCRSVLRNLATGYTRSTWHAGRLFIHVYIKPNWDIVSERTFGVLEQL